MISFNNRISDGISFQEPTPGSNPLEDTFLMEPTIKYQDSMLTVQCEPHKAPAIFYSN